MAATCLADLLAALSQAGDLGMGQPPGSFVHSCLVDLGRGLPRHSRVRVLATALRMGLRFDQELTRANCEVATHIAGPLNLDAAQRGQNDFYERRDGKGHPRRLAGDNVESHPSWPVWMQNRLTLAPLGSIWEYHGDLNT